jgi:mRNA interferase MazF
VKRGDFVTVALQGEAGKPRPALIVQSDRFDRHATVTVLPLTSTAVDAPLFRIPVEPDTDNGLQQTSHVMVDKIVTVRREKVGPAFGAASDALMQAVNRALVLFLSIAR